MRLSKDHPQVYEFLKQVRAMRALQFVNDVMNQSLDEAATKQAERRVDDQLHKWKKEGLFD